MTLRLTILATFTAAGVLAVSEVMVLALRAGLWRLTVRRPPGTIVEPHAASLAIEVGATPSIRADLARRTERGRITYGRPLTTANGRDAIVDADEELLDAVQYVAQASAEGRLSAWRTVVAMRALVVARRAIGGGA